MEVDWMNEANFMQMLAPGAVLQQPGLGAAPAL